MTRFGRIRRWLLLRLLERLVRPPHLSVAALRQHGTRPDVHHHPDDHGDAMSAGDAPRYDLWPNTFGRYVPDGSDGGKYTQVPEWHPEDHPEDDDESDE
jgi:hypothetical protein